MFSSNETLEIPLWRSSSCRRMRDVFGLQCQFLQIVCVEREKNTRPGGFKPYFITPAGYLSSCSLKRHLNHQSVHTEVLIGRRNVKPPLFLVFQTNTKTILFL